MYVKMFHHTTPVKLGALDHKKYIYAICRCPVDTSYGLRIERTNFTKEEKECGWCHIHCEKCGSDIELACERKAI